MWGRPSDVWLHDVPVTRWSSTSSRRQCVSQHICQSTDHTRRPTEHTSSPHHSTPLCTALHSTTSRCSLPRLDRWMVSVVCGYWLVRPWFTRWRDVTTTTTTTATCIATGALVAAAPPETGVSHHISAAIAMRRHLTLSSSPSTPLAAAAAAASAAVLAVNDSRMQYWQLARYMPTICARCPVRHQRRSISKVDGESPAVESRDRFTAFHIPSYVRPSVYPLGQPCSILPSLLRAASVGDGPTGRAG